jgi:hypothetical protein
VVDGGLDPEEPGLDGDEPVAPTAAPAEDGGAVEFGADLVDEGGVGCEDGASVDGAVPSPPMAFAP